MSKFTMAKPSSTNPLGADLRLGLCFPRACSPKSINEIIQEIVKSNGTFVTMCTTNDKIPFTTIDWVAM